MQWPYLMRHAEVEQYAGVHSSVKRVKPRIAFFVRKSDRTPFRQIDQLDLDSLPVKLPAELPDLVVITALPAERTAHVQILHLYISPSNRAAVHCASRRITSSKSCAATESAGRASAPRAIIARQFCRAISMCACN